MNWNTCTKGGQSQTSGTNVLLDDLLADPGFTIGVLPLGDGDCQAAVRVLGKRDIVSGKSRASDAAFNLAAQLLAAELNLSSGARTCQRVVNAVADGQALLSNIGFDGTGTYLKGKSNATARNLANSLASTLDRYNQGRLC